MTLPRTVAEVLTDHVVFEIECIDRMYCNVYVPQLQHAGGLLGYVQRQLGLPIASTLGRGWHPYAPRHGPVTNRRQNEQIRSACASLAD